MKVTEKRTFLVELEPGEMHELDFILHASSEVRSKKWKNLNTRAKMLREILMKAWEEATDG